MRPWLLDGGINDATAKLFEIDAVVLRRVNRMFESARVTSANDQLYCASSTILVLPCVTKVKRLFVRRSDEQACVVTLDGQTWRPG